MPWWAWILVGAAGVILWLGIEGAITGKRFRRKT